ncbi:MAG: hypothetical protein JXM73_05360 [Anaerolineae bacterium]|nr:hypothetical protein [Anaerolineae bacterium]
MGARAEAVKTRLSSGWAWVRATAGVALRDRRSKRLLVVAVLALSFSFMGYLVYRNWQQLEAYRQHWQMHYPLILLAFALYPAGLAPNVVGWHMLMKRLGGLHRFKINAQIYCYSCLPKQLPGGVWHVAGRAYLNKEQGIQASVTLLGSSVEWVLLIASGLLVYLLSCLAPLPVGDRAAGLDPGVALALLAPLLIVLCPPVFNRVASWLLSRLRRPTPPPLGWGDLLGLLGVYVIAWVMGGVVLYVLSQALVPLSPAALPAVIGAWGGAGAIGFVAVYFLQGLGIRDVTLALLLSSIMPLSAAAVVSILFRLLITVGEILWPLLWARLLGRVR